MTAHLLSRRVFSKNSHQSRRIELQVVEKDSAIISVIAFAAIIMYNTLTLGERLMATSLSEFPGTVTPTPADAKLALESSQKLAKFLGSKKKEMRLRIQSGNEPEETVAVPLAAFRLLTDILAEMAQGNPVAFIPVHSELSTQQAADLLNVSRPYLIDLLEKGLIPHRKVGTHRRVLFQDLMAYKQKTDADRLKALEELSALDQELGGMGY
jgi:excisionase family DNA binding protein